MDLLEIMRNRRTVRAYTDENISKENLEKVLQAGLLSASGKAIRPWEFIVVQEREMLEKLSGCRAGGVKMLQQAQCAIVVVAKETAQDVWIEDCSVAMANMHLMASSLGLGSCWVQGRLRKADGEKTTEEFVRNCLGFPQEYKLAAILTLGMPAQQIPAYELDALHTEKIRWEKF